MLKIRLFLAIFLSASLLVSGIVALGIADNEEDNDDGNTDEAGVIPPELEYLLSARGGQQHDKEQ